jgi:hypothetical protein
VVSLGCAGAAFAADTAPAPYPSAFAAPGIAPAASCPTCEAAAPAECASCKSKLSLFHKHGCKPYQPHLCPGACFGYFQTQWHRWENVCPIPYQGVDLADAPARPVPAINPPLIPAKPDTKGSSDAPAPKPSTKPDTTPEVKPAPMSLIPPLPPTLNPTTGKK